MRSFLLPRLRLHWFEKKQIIPALSVWMSFVFIIPLGFAQPSETSSNPLISKAHALQADSDVSNDLEVDLDFDTSASSDEIRLAVEEHFSRFSERSEIPLSERRRLIAKLIELIQHALEVDEIERQDLVGFFQRTVSRMNLKKVGVQAFRFYRWKGEQDTLRFFIPDILMGLMMTETLEKTFLVWGPEVFGGNPTTDWVLRGLGVLSASSVPIAGDLLCISFLFAYGLSVTVQDTVSGVRVTLLKSARAFSKASQLDLIWRKIRGRPKTSVDALAETNASQTSFVWKFEMDPGALRSGKLQLFQKNESKAYESPLLTLSVQAGRDHQLFYTEVQWDLDQLSLVQRQSRPWKKALRGLDWNLRNWVKETARKLLQNQVHVMADRFYVQKIDLSEGGRPKIHMEPKAFPAKMQLCPMIFERLNRRF